MAASDTKISNTEISNTETSDKEIANVTVAHTAGSERAIIYVCVTCRGPSGLVADPLPGELLAAATREAARGSGVEVRPIKCLANCSRGPSAALRANGSWTYLFGGLDPTCASALVTGAHMLAVALDGLLPWRGRPEVLKRGLLARTPPIGFREDNL